MGKVNKNQQKRFRPKYKIKKDDTVIVIAGNDKGEEGRVLMVDTKRGRVLVEGVNIRTKHVRPNEQNPQGGRIEQEATIDISNVMLKDPKTGEPTRIGRRTEGDKIVRYAKKSGEVLK